MTSQACSVHRSNPSQGGMRGETLGVLQGGDEMGGWRRMEAAGQVRGTDLEDRGGELHRGESHHIVVNHC